MNVLFEDNHLLVVAKPPALLSQPGPAGKPDLLTQCKEYLRAKYHKPGNVFLGLVHRLDWGVGGVMVFAKTSKAASRLAAQFRERTVEKQYEAVVTGEMRPKSGELVAKLIKDVEQRKAALVGDGDGDEDVGDDARLTYRVVGTGELPGVRVPVSVLEIELHSGRFHQIRAQLAAAGHPIIGDGKYGSKVTVPGLLLGLRAAVLVLNHPTTGERMRFALERPGEWQTALRGVGA